MAPKKAKKSGRLKFEQHKFYGRSAVVLAALASWSGVCASSCPYRSKCVSGFVFFVLVCVFSGINAILMFSISQALKHVNRLKQDDLTADNLRWITKQYGVIARQAPKLSRYTFFLTTVSVLFGLYVAVTVCPARGDPVWAKDKCGCKPCGTTRAVGWPKGTVCQPVSALATKAISATGETATGGRRLTATALEQQQQAQEDAAVAQAESSSAPVGDCNATHQSKSDKCYTDASAQCDCDKRLADASLQSCLLWAPTPSAEFGIMVSAWSLVFLWSCRASRNKKQYPFLYEPDPDVEELQAQGALRVLTCCDQVSRLLHP
eukprot:TRINITY_DN108898_c0_g1_i1.p1 TRINITY_DN108898_c0_g1~~TRINITY_DN108898_c0_g1_i1.p1  ORF type:complete len:320 (+),score=42.12 TRINITY_DN108898_c0_g1_i1:76-1035(+)